MLKQHMFDDSLEHSSTKPYGWAFAYLGMICKRYRRCTGLSTRLQLSLHCPFEGACRFWLPVSSLMERHWLLRFPESIHRSWMRLS